MSREEFSLPTTIVAITGATCIIGIFCGWVLETAGAAVLFAVWVAIAPPLGWWQHAYPMSVVLAALLFSLCVALLLVMLVRKMRGIWLDWLAPLALRGAGCAVPESANLPRLWVGGTVAGLIGSLFGGWPWGHL